jgi:hypothetical protein
MNWSSIPRPSLTTSLDDADRAFRPTLENSMPLDQQRARDVATDVARIMRAKGNLAELVRQHIEGLGLTLPRLYRLNRFARNTLSMATS